MLIKVTSITCVEFHALSDVHSIQSAAAGVESGNFIRFKDHFVRVARKQAVEIYRVLPGSDRASSTRLRPADLPL